jgi:glycosyltransferase involved in cell wall biosynthesis
VDTEKSDDVLAGGGAIRDVTDSVTVVIPCYNMDWCVERAIRSCQAQGSAIAEIIVVDDCSPDRTSEVVARLAADDRRIRCVRPEQNLRHLGALRFGAREAKSDWVALLDADDELLDGSVAMRVRAAQRYRASFGEDPGLVYGDHATNRFVQLNGHAFAYLCRELCLCQTSTIMLSSQAVSLIPQSDNPWNTDDEIVLAVGKRHPVVHCGHPVANYCTHDAPTRMSNDKRKIFLGVRQLVRDHRADILVMCGGFRLWLWRLRVVRAYCVWRFQAGLPASGKSLSERAYLKLLLIATGWLDRLLKPQFDTYYF